MKKTQKYEDSWDENSFTRGSQLKRNVALSVIGAFVLFGGYSILTSVETSQDAHMHYIRQDFDKSLDVIDSILSNPEQSAEYEQALNIKVSILLDEKGDYYDIHEAYSSLKELYRTNPTIETARKIVSLGDELELKEKELFKYIEFLAKKRDIDSLVRASRYYMADSDIRVKMKARKYLELMPETSEKFLNIAQLELLSGTTNSSIKAAEQNLNSAVFQGSSEAMIELAFLQLLKADQDKFAAAEFKAQFPVMVKKAVDMGYRGVKLKQAAIVIKYGRYGVPQDMTLADLIEEIIKNDAS
ncbi:hypothetical protein OTK49_00405 [Vibrio coralliirubri]|uniref:hypothetical protein n=1 Tax=Vibrio coralliirubri TaxID=1516159 RepID=UPI002284D32A|nr:hypothetical protein [Vibrio coralliirubri]MCY9861002.1 hypothetical protein [Vibrio coralliirubri]